mmetsp:Transcript_17170/g.48266  ORF Transcript_17170/g.48266 Transcript_17170/m.48266 type:complete len:116 (+) Transcript_17170:162-509(+)
MTISQRDNAFLRRLSSGNPDAGDAALDNDDDDDGGSVKLHRQFRSLPPFQAIRSLRCHLLQHDDTTGRKRRIRSRYSWSSIMTGREERDAEECGCDEFWWSLTTPAAGSWRLVRG